MGKAEVLRAFRDMTSPQVRKRNDAFNDGWRITDSWCSTRTVARHGKDVARVEIGPRGGLTVTMF